MYTATATHTTLRPIGRQVTSNINKRRAPAAAAAAAAHWAQCLHGRPLASAV